MDIATITAIRDLDLANDNSYHLCLAHLLHDNTYFQYFRSRARVGDLVMLDNGVVETGLPMEMSVLLRLAHRVEASEMVLPDSLNDSTETLRLGREAIAEWEGEPGLIAVPQGRSFSEWHACMLEMLTWPVVTIGISKFTAKFASTRMQLLAQSPELIDSKMDIHLLGCLSISNEIFSVKKAFPGRIRGVDSGIAAIAAQQDIAIDDIRVGGRVNTELDFFIQDESPLLRRNIASWKKMCLTGEGGRHDGKVEEHVISDV